MGGYDPRARREYRTVSGGPRRLLRSRTVASARSVITRSVPVSNPEVLVAKFSFLLGFGAGYVLGARAGRERYEQIVGLWSDAKDNPQLQGLAGMAQARADDVVSSVKSRMGRDTGADSDGAHSAVRSTGTTTVPPATTTEAPDLTALPADPPPVG